MVMTDWKYIFLIRILKIMMVGPYAGINSDQLFYLRILKKNTGNPFFGHFFFKLQMFENFDILPFQMSNDIFMRDNFISFRINLVPLLYT